MMRQKLIVISVLVLKYPPHFKYFRSFLSLSRVIQDNRKHTEIKRATTMLRSLGIGREKLEIGQLSTY